MPTPEAGDRSAAAAVAQRRERFAVARFMRRWHRLVGAGAALFLVCIATSGVLLMHSDRLGLPAAQIDSPLLLHWYGIQPTLPHGFQSDGHWFSQLGGHLYFDRVELPFGEGELRGVFVVAPEASSSEWLVVTDQQALLVDGQGEVRERLGREAALPPGVTAAGRDAAGQIVVASGQGRFRYDADMGEFVASPEDAAVHWSSAGTPPAAITEAITHAYRGAGVSIERFLLDLHSGRLFGTLGVVVVNLASLVLVYLAASGLFLWARRQSGTRRER